MFPYIRSHEVSTLGFQSVFSSRFLKEINWHDNWFSHSEANAVQSQLIYSLFDVSDCVKFRLLCQFLRLHKPFMISWYYRRLQGLQLATWLPDWPFRDTIEQSKQQKRRCQGKSGHKSTYCSVGSRHLGRGCSRGSECQWASSVNTLVISQCTSS